MKATGSSTEGTIWNYFCCKGFSPAGVAGLMGNLYAESGLNPINLQNTYEKRLGLTDAEYTAAVDSGSYSNFVRDSAGYGLAQWTYWSRKEAMLNYARKTGASIGDLMMQLGFMFQELKGHVAVFQVLRTARTVKEASDIVLTKYERPADMSNAVKVKRAGFGQAYYDAYANTTTTPEKEEITVSNSSLVTYTNITKNKTSPRNHAIDTITIHCIVGQWTAKQGCDFFATTDRECSANYIVGKDGSIGLSVDEADRSWCTSSRENDNRAITIEVASDTEHPYAVTDAAYAALIKLIADICKRNGIKKLIWSTNKADRVNHANGCNMTVHRDYANKACPGQYLYDRHGAIAAAVNELLGSGTTQPPEAAPGAVQGFPATPFTVRVIIPDLNYRKGPGMSYAVRGQTGKGVFTITEVQDGWGKLKSGAGWIYLENPGYCTIQGVAAKPEAAPGAVQGFPATPFTVRVIIPDLNYRKGPGMSYAVRGQTGKGVFTITEVQDGWGKLKSGAGWIYLENPGYCTIQGVAAKPAEPDPADVLAQEIAGKVKGSGLDPADVLNRVEKILGVA